MSEKVSYRCDICQIEKQDTNHWWKGYSLGGGKFLVAPWDVTDWPSTQIGDTTPVEIAHLCGHAHVTQWVNSKLRKEDA